MLSGEQGQDGCGEGRADLPEGNGQVPEDRSRAQTAILIQVDARGPYTYIGQASAGAAGATPAWQIKRVANANPTACDWADGDPEFDNIWDDRASLPYS